MSKGSKQRPRDVSKEQFESNWEKAFGKNKQVPQEWAEHIEEMIDKHFERNPANQKH